LIKALGFTLLEVLVSLLLLGLMLLFFDTAQYAAWHANQSAYELTQATQQVRSMSERLKMLGGYPDFKEQLSIWNQENQLILPNGKGYVSGQYPRYSIQLCWDSQGNQRCIQKGLL